MNQGALAFPSSRVAENGMGDSLLMKELVHCCHERPDFPVVTPQDATALGEEALSLGVCKWT